RERVRAGWAVAGWLVAAWQITLGFGIGLPFAYVMVALGVVGTVIALIRGPRVRLPLANLAGLVVFAVVGAVMAWPYLQVTAQHPYARRTEGDLALFSPPLRGFFVAPPESLVWGDLHAGARAG